MIGAALILALLLIYALGVAHGVSRERKRHEGARKGYVSNWGRST